MIQPKRLKLFFLSMTVGLVCVFFAHSIQAQSSFTEDFSHEKIEGQWSFGPYPTQIVKDPETKKSYLYLSIQDIWFPILRTESSNNAFVGDYRKTQVTELSVEAKWFDEFYQPTTRAFSLMLIHGNYAAFQVSSDTLQESYLKWHTYTFAIPSTSEDFKKAGWQVVPWPNVADELLNADSHFEEILQDVQQVRIYYFNPTYLTYLQNYNVGATNISIKRAE